MPTRIFRIPDFQKKMLDAAASTYVIFGHIGDCHLHANLLPKDDAGSEAYLRPFVAQSIMLGGCISAEHASAS
ncbi:MAG: hypothetical protein IPM25_20285 [Chloracidobacterium sp.]|nr:hypothetical protein [Chloracidobacterium sp.]